MESEKVNNKKLYNDYAIPSNLALYEYSKNPQVIKDYIFANISIALVKSEEMEEDVNKLYSFEKETYHNAVMNSSSISHVVLKQGSLEQEINARKALGMLITAEHDDRLKGKIIKLLRKYYPFIYRSVKKLDKRELKIRYLQMDEVTRKTEARLDEAVYFYFSMHCAGKSLDEGFILTIINDINAFELYSPMTTNIEKELIAHKDEIEKIKSYIEEKYGDIFDLKKVLNTVRSEVEDLATITENIFMINKLDINQILYEAHSINIDRIILAYIKRGYDELEPDILLQTVVNGLFLQHIIDEYKRSRQKYFEDSREDLFFKLSELENKLRASQQENKILIIRLEQVQGQKVVVNKELHDEVNKLNKKHKCEIVTLESRIKELENQLKEEEQHRNELNSLREYIFQVKNEYMPAKVEANLEKYIEDRTILIIGGAKEWRRRFRIKYPVIKTMNGFNENFEISILNNVDYIFFYTGYMNHSTYNRAMSYIRNHQIKFGYIGKTNMQLVEEEIIEELQRLRMGRRLNLSE